MKALKSQINAKRNDIPLVLNKLLRDKDGNPIGMTEDPNDVSSVNLGTPRMPERGKCYMGDGQGYVSCGEISTLNIVNFGIEFNIFIPNNISSNFTIVSNCKIDLGDFLLSGYYIKYNVQTKKILLTFWRTDTDQANIGSTTELNIDLFNTWNKIKIIINSKSNYTFTNSNVRWYINDKFKKETILYNSIGYNDQENTIFLIGAQNKENDLNPMHSGIKIFGIKIFNINIRNWKKLNDIAFYKCDESNGNIVYDCSGNNNHGNIINAITTIPYSKDNNSFHNIQDVHSWQNDVGYSYLRAMSSYPDDIKSTWGTKSPIFGDLVVRNMSYDADEYGKFPGIYMDEYGKYFYCVNAARFETHNNYTFKRGNILVFKVYSNNVKFSVRETSGPGQTLISAINDFVNSKGLSDRYITTIKSWYDNANSTEKLELDQIFIDRNVNSFQIYYDNTPSTWYNTDLPWYPMYTINLKYNYYNEQQFTIPDELYSNSNYFSYIKILGNLAKKIDSSIIKNVNKSKWYYFYVLYSEDKTFVPKDESIKVPPFKDVTNRNLQFINKVPSIAFFKQSNCFRGNGLAAIRFSSYNEYKNLEIKFKIKFGGTNDTRAILSRLNRNTPTYNKSWYIYHTGGNTIKFEIYTYNSEDNIYTTHRVSLPYVKNKWYEYSCKVYNGNLLISDGEQESTLTFDGEYANSSLYIYLGAKTSGYYQNNYYDLIYDLIFNELDSNGDIISNLAHLPLCESLYKSTSFKYHDISGNGRHSLWASVQESMIGKQDRYHYLQNGFLIYNGIYVPILKDKSAFANGIALTHSNAILQDEKSYLNTYSTKLQVLKYPSLQQADLDSNIWYDGINNNYPPKLVNHYKLNTEFNLNKKISKQ